MALSIVDTTIAEASANSVTSASHTVAKGNVCLAMASSNGDAGGVNGDISINAEVDGALEFVRIIQEATRDAPAAAFWKMAWEDVTRVTTVTNTSGDPGISVTVFEISGAETVFGGATASSSSGSGSATVNITTTRANSYVFGASADWTAQGNYTAGTGETLDNTHHIASTYSAGQWHSTSVVASPGSYTSDAGGSSTRDHNTIAVEIREPGTDFPVVNEVLVQGFAAATDHNVTMPATVTAGELLLVLLTTDTGTSATVTLPSGWTQESTDANGTEVRFGVYSKVADGTEDGTNVNFITSASAAAVAITCRISNWYGAIAGVEVGTAATGTSTAPDPPSLTPSWGALNTLWIGCYGEDDDDPPTGGAIYTTQPGFTGFAYHEASTIGTLCSGAAAFDESASATVNPAAFTTLSEGWVAQTVAIRPAVVVSLVDDDSMPVLMSVVIEDAA